MCVDELYVYVFIHIHTPIDQWCVFGTPETPISKVKTTVGLTD